MNVHFTKDELRPLVRELIREVVLELMESEWQMDDRIAYPEHEAARMLSMTQFQLRDERLKGRIRATQISGRKIRYTRQDLLDYLEERRFKAK